MKSFKSISLIAVVIIGSILSIYRLNNLHQKEIAWDVLGYYLPLPATFIQSDPLLTDISWLEDLNEEKRLTGTLYMVSENEKGEPMYFFMFGMSIFYLLFFAIGHVLANLMGYPPDGFSEPYMIALVIGALIYMIIGLFYFRKILLHFFSEKITVIVIVMTVFATNYIQELTLKNLETVNVLFMLSCFTLWYTIKWHQEQKMSYMLRVGLSIVLMALVKPSEIMIVFVPLMWMVYSKESIGSKWELLKKNQKQIWTTIVLCLLVLSPQMIYWFIKTGTPIYDSYKNPGVGLDIFSPHILEVLFSYRKGWLLYTPIMIFFLAGLPIIYRTNKKIFFGISVYFFISFYIISSWSEWWYGASYSIRPLITTYPFLAVGFGYFLTYIFKKDLWIKVATSAAIVFFLFFTQFQWWQFKTYIIDPYRTTKEYYWSVFMQTKVTAEQKEYLSVYRDFTGSHDFNNREKYSSRVLSLLDFENLEEEDGAIKLEGKNCYPVKSDVDYALTEKVEYRTITNDDHVWIGINFDAKFPSNENNSYPNFIMSMDRKEGNYGYFGREIKPDQPTEEWQSYEYFYMTPAIRNRKDVLKYFFWNDNHQDFFIDNFKLTVYDKKPIK